ncbi:MAG TPA: protein kinase, partial [Gemmataceae bacterium]
MAVLAHCPSPGCSGSYRIPDGFASRSIRCPICKKSFTPGPEKFPTKESASPNTPVADASSPKQNLAAAAFPTSALKGLGRFVVLGRLGVGAFGTVYKARDPHLDRDVALKVPNPGMLDSPKRIERFLREARAAARLRHPNIVPVFDAGKEGEYYFIASAFVDGRPLSESIGERGMDVRRAAEIVRRLAEAIAYAHGQGIVHRDVKPANIMLDLDEQPHLMDFGLAARANEAEKLTNDGAVLGTPAYMAPEQAGGKKGDASPRSDQYALGVVLYELLTGQAPFHGPPAAVLYKVIHHEPTPPAQVRGSPLPRDLETICLKAMSKNPDDRYPDCQAFADDLRRWLAGEPIAARRHSAVERLIRWTKNNRIVAASLAITALSLVTGAGAALGFAFEARQRSAEAENALRAADIAREAAVASAAKADSLLDQLVGEENRGKDLENRVDAIVA